MIFEEYTCRLGDKNILLRSPKQSDADIMRECQKQISGETRFLTCNEDEVNFTQGQEAQFIQENNDAPDHIIICAFVDGEYAGNCMLDNKAYSGGTRRKQHRGGVGIGLKQKYTGFGLGRLMLMHLLEIAKKCKYEQVELIVVSNNSRARNLYESFGFKEYGCIPKANKYDDGTYSDDILMVLDLRD